MVGSHRGQHTASVLKQWMGEKAGGCGSSGAGKENGDAGQSVCEGVGHQVGGGAGGRWCVGSGGGEGGGGRAGTAARLLWSYAPIIWSRRLVGQAGWPKPLGQSHLRGCAHVVTASLIAGI